MKIVFMGTPDFAVPSLHALTEAGYAVAAVVTQPDKPKVGPGPSAGAISMRSIPAAKQQADDIRPVS